MTAFKTLAKATFSGGVLGAIIGLFGGAIIGLIIWPTSNLAPFAGFFYGLPVGICVGVVAGFVTGLSRIKTVKRNVKHEDSDHNHKSSLRTRLDEKAERRE